MHRLQHLHFQLARRRPRALHAESDRRGGMAPRWHPERFAPPASDSSILIVGGGPAGLECAVTLARRGYAVTLAESAPEFGGRLRFETRLPGLATWGRVVDWRLGQLRGRSNVSLYPGSELKVDDIMGLEHSHVVIATGARWTRMLFSSLEFAVGQLDGAGIYTRMTWRPARFRRARGGVRLRQLLHGRRRCGAAGEDWGPNELCDDGGQRIRLDLHDQ